MIPARRRFLKDSGALAGSLLLSGAMPVQAARGEAVEVAYFVKIAADGRVLMQLAKHEMGQGVAGSLAAIVADEIGADWEQVEVVFMDYDARYRFNTGGSTTVMGMYEPLRKVAATARERLVAAAAAQWQVAPGECTAAGGAVRHAASGRRAGFGELASRVPPPTDPVLRDFLAAARPALKPAREFRVIGTPRANKTVPAIVRGALQFAGDVRVPGMLRAVIARAPVYRGRLKSFDARAALAVPGVKQVVAIEPYLPEMTVANDQTSWCVHGGVAVLATSTWAAIQGRAALKVEWEDGANGRFDSASWRKHVRAAAAAREAKNVHAQGNREALERSATRVSAMYEYPFEPHSPMETMNCLAHARADGGAEIWVGTQNTGNIVDSAQRVLGIAPKDLVVHHLPSGGSFGRRYYPDVAIEALKVSRAAGNVPVHVLWTREDETRHDHFHFDSHDRYEGGFDAAGNLVAVHMREASCGFVAGAANWNPYDIPHKHHDALGLAHEALLKTGAWRSVTNNAWGMGQECFMDELAHHAGVDPLAFRLKHLGKPQVIRAWGSERTTDPARLRRVLQAAAEKAGWGRKLPAGHGLGIACYDYIPVGAYCAHVAEVSVVQGRLIVHRITCALDCGLVVNPDGVRAQVEGNMVWGLTAVLKGNVQVENGRVLNSNFHDQPILRMSECPPIDIVLVPGAETPGGVGETSLPSLVPAVLNALFAATGKRVRHLPVREEDLR